jgi:hypothetical protein
MYEILCDFNKLDDEKIWINIWKLKITERNRCFMWLVKHNRLLLTKQVKSRMGLGSACCDYCGEEETSLHVLRDCGLAMGVWMAIVPNDMRDTFFEGNSNYWFQINIMADYFIEGNLCWRDVWATTCHCLWYWRNMDSSPSQPLLFICNILYFLKLSQPRNFLYPETEEEYYYLFRRVETLDHTFFGMTWRKGYVDIACYNYVFLY